MKDFKGNELKVGDTVIFSLGDTNLREDTIEELIGEHLVILTRIKRSISYKKIYKIN